MKQGRPQLVVGFAAETKDLVAHARAKLARKGCDLIVANDVSPQTGVMGGDENTIFIVSPDGEEAWPTLEKDEAARRLVALIGARLREKSNGGVDGVSVKRLPHGEGLPCPPIRAPAPPGSIFSPPLPPDAPIILAARAVAP